MIDLIHLSLLLYHLIKGHHPVMVPVIEDHGRGKLRRVLTFYLFLHKVAALGLEPALLHVSAQAFYYYTKQWPLASIRGYDGWSPQLYSCGEVWLVDGHLASLFPTLYSITSDYMAFVVDPWSVRLGGLCGWDSVFRRNQWDEVLEGVGSFFVGHGVSLRDIMFAKNKSMRLKLVNIFSVSLYCSFLHFGRTPCERKLVLLMERAQVGAPLA